MRNKNTRKLSLNRETIALLDAELGAVNGGAKRGTNQSIYVRCGVTRTCPGVCFSKGDDSCFGCDTETL